MPRPNALVDEIKDISDPAALRVAAREGPRGQYLTVAFASGRTGLLDVTEHRSRVWAEVLESLRESGTPAYVEIDPRTGLITEVLQPVRFTVGRLSPVSDGVEVELVPSQARHYLRRSDPDFDALRRRLEEARRAPRPLWVTETLTEHEIIDVRPAPGEAVRSRNARRRG